MLYKIRMIADIMRALFSPRFLTLLLITVLLFYPADTWAAGDFEVTINVSRDSGIAPLSVFFDATQTPDLADGGYLDATFAWNFDADNTDPGANYRSASGFVAAHVFENPGTYRVYVDVYDSLGRHAYEQVTITVQPFSGATYYVAEDGRDADTGLSMADPVQTVEHALRDLAQPNSRILFKRGDTFETGFVSASERPGPVIVGSYEDPDSPSDQAPIIYNTSVDSDWATITIGNDWRIMDLKVRSGGDTAGESGPRYPGGVGFGDSDNSLIYRLEQYYLHGYWMDPYGQYNTVAECNIHHVSGTGYSSGGDGGAIIGNWVHDKGEEDPEHVYRLQGGSRYFIGFNNFEANIINYDSLTIRGNAEKIVIYKNTLDRVTGIWPQVRNAYEEYQHHCIIDSNLFIGRVDPPNYPADANLRQMAIGLHSKDIVLRNNIFYNYQFGINVSNDTVVGPSQRIKIYNNTSINMTPDSDFYFVSVDPECTDIEVKNNVILDNAGSRAMYTRIIRDRSDSYLFNGASDHNVFFGDTWNSQMTLFGTLSLSQWQDTTGQDLNSFMQDPGLASTDTASTNFARPVEGSPLINSGELVATALDFHGNLRDLSPDVGAIEYFSGLVDDQAPTTPTGLAATAISATQVNLSWSEAVDNTAVSGYRIYRSNDRIGVATTMTFSDSTCTPAATYIYAVSAYDAAGNESPLSDPVTVSTTDNDTGDDDDGQDDGGNGGCFICSTVGS